MTKPVLIDTGPLVAYLNRADHHYRWAKSQLSGLSPPLLNCEDVLADSPVLTLDGDFRIYRRNVRQAIPLIIPDS